MSAASLAAAIASNPGYTGSSSIEVQAGVTVNGTIIPLQVDSTGRPIAATAVSAAAPTVATAIGSPKLYTNFGVETLRSIQATPSQLLSVRCTNINAAIRYLQFYNVVTLAGAPLYSEPMAAGSSTAPSSLILDNTFFGANGKYFDTGLYMCISTTPTFYTAATATDHFTSVHYI